MTLKWNLNWIQNKNFSPNLTTTLNPTQQQPVHAQSKPKIPHRPTAQIQNHHQQQPPRLQHHQQSCTSNQQRLNANQATKVITQAMLRPPALDSPYLQNPHHHQQQQQQQQNRFNPNSAPQLNGNLHGSRQSNPAYGAPSNLQLTQHQQQQAPIKKPEQVLTAILNSTNSNSTIIHQIPTSKTQPAQNGRLRLEQTLNRLPILAHNKPVNSNGNPGHTPALPSPLMGPAETKSNSNASAPPVQPNQPNGKSANEECEVILLSLPVSKATPSTSKSSSSSSLLSSPSTAAVSRPHAIAQIKTEPTGAAPTSEQEDELKVGDKPSKYIRIYGHLSSIYCVCFDRSGQFIFTVNKEKKFL